MSVLLSDLRVYGSADMPEADGSAIGGAIDFSKRIEFGTVTTPTLYDLVSSSASDTATKLIYSGRDSTGVIQTETLTANGTTKVAGSKSLERLLAALASGAGSAFGLTTPGGTTAVGDLALMAHALTITAHTMQSGAAAATASAPAIAKLQSGDGASVVQGMVLHTTGGTGPHQIRRILAVNPGGLGADVVALDRNWGTLPDNTTTYEVAPGMHFELAGSSQGVALTGTATQVGAITRLFTGASADVSGGSNRSYYEKAFVNNNNLTTAWTVATVEITANSPSLPAGAALDIGVTAALNDTATATNRQTAPGSVSFIVQPAAITVPTGNLPASAGAGDATGACAVWLRLDLTAGAAAYEGSPGATLQTLGDINLMATTDYTALVAAWNGATQPPAGVAGTPLAAGMTTAQKLAAVNSWSVAGPHIDVPASQVVRCLAINLKLATLLKYAAAPPASEAGACAAELAAVLSMGSNAPPFYTSQAADYAALQGMLNALAGDSNSGIAAADATALLALASGPAISWCEANGYPYSGLNGGLNLNDLAAAGLG